MSFFNAEFKLYDKPAYLAEGKVFLRVNDTFHKESTTKILGDIICHDNTNSQEIILYVEGNDYELKPGTVISFYSALDEIKNMGNPSEFDYVEYMANNGIFYQQKLKNNEYAIVGSSPTISNYATICRNFLINRVFNSNLSPEAQDFLVAILLGDKRFLDSELKHSFSNIGIAHILALSGLHIGIIGLIIFYLLFFLDYLGLRKLRLIISILLLTVYAFISGCSPSVIRALLMYVFLATSIILNRKNSVLNSVSASAIIILLVSPNDLYDIGFQLSYLAVFSIILFTPLLNPLSYKHKLFGIFNYFLVSVSAMLGTGVLSAYYFNIVPSLFIIPNLLIVPLLPIFLLDGLFVIISDFSIFTYCFEILYKFIIFIIDYIGGLSISSFIVHLNLLQLIALYFAIGFLYLMLKYRKNVIVKSVSAVLITLCLCIYPFISDDKKNFKLIIFNDFKETPILIGNSATPRFVPVVNDKFILSFNQNNKCFLSEYALGDIQIADYMPAFLDRSIYYFICNDKRFIVVDSTVPKVELLESEKIDVDYLIITKNCHCSVSRVMAIFNAEEIIISGNVFDEKRLKIINSCHELKIPFFDIREKGAFMFS